MEFSRPECESECFLVTFYDIIIVINPQSGKVFLSKKSGHVSKKKIIEFMLCVARERITIFLLRTHTIRIVRNCSVVCFQLSGESIIETAGSVQNLK